MDIIIDNIKLFLTDHYNKILEAVDHLEETDFNIYLDKAYDEIQNESFDKGVLEKSKNIQAVRGYFDWNDIGSLEGLSKTIESDASGNCIKGLYHGIDTCNSVIYAEGAFIAAIGVENMIIASTKDAIIVCPKNRAEDIKYLVEQLKLNGYEDYV
jgi:mannose-1-phosphate guanylyltransferase